MKKFTWIDTQIPLIEQIRAALKQGSYPVFVSEGMSNEKVERIRPQRLPLQNVSGIYRA
jgi:hypothetical protein